MLGHVALLRRYPVKSMLGENIRQAHVTAAGLPRDRRLALVHEATGKVASAKYPRLWRDMLLPRATAAGDTAAGDDDEDGPVLITFPDGRELLSTDDRVHRELSAYLGQSVTLTATPPDGAELDRAVPDAVLRDGTAADVPVRIIRLGEASPAGTFYDFAPLHLLTTATLTAIDGHRDDGGHTDPHRYRPNLVISTSTPGFAENDWAGRDLAVGPDLVIRVIARTSRCAVPTLRHGAGSDRDADALRIPARHNRVAPLDHMPPEPCAGVYAQVLRPGTIRPGDPVAWS